LPGAVARPQTPPYFYLLSKSGTYTLFWTEWGTDLCVVAIADTRLTGRRALEKGNCRAAGPHLVLAEPGAIRLGWQPAKNYLIGPAPAWITIAIALNAIGMMVSAMVLALIQVAAIVTQV
jgi:hypothetical protein